VVLQRGGCPSWRDVHQHIAHRAPGDPPVFRALREPRRRGGTLGLLILKAVSLGPQHGYGVLQRIQQISGGLLHSEQGALYPALYRLETKGLIEAQRGVSDNNRQAKFYTLTRTGRARLAHELDGWQAFFIGMNLAIAARSAE
jgi:transcriptional regulator